ncbi:MAG: hypothetical protein IPL39_12315 [Opitutaceae bacterium]|nr:hypothetical protein [Opitutaceae bacterium]
MATVKTILSDLVHDFPDVVSSFRDSGAVGFFGLAGEKVLAADERLRASLQGSTRAREPDNGITAVIRSVLQEHELALRSLNSQGLPIAHLDLWRGTSYQGVAGAMEASWTASTRGNCCLVQSKRGGVLRFAAEVDQRGRSARGGLGRDFLEIL